MWATIHPTVPFVAEALLRYRADVRLANTYGRTALMAAALAGAHECMLQLLQAGAEMGAKDRGGQTAHGLV